MFSISTAWNARLHDNGRDIVDQIRLAGFDSIELNFTLTEKIVEEILALSRRSEIKVASLHNMCPLPAEIRPQEASPDHYSLASLDERERSLAVSAARVTIDWANKFGARAVVLHLGRVPVKDRINDLVKLLDDKERFEVFRSEMIGERMSKGRAYLDNAIKSLKELIPHAAQKGVALGVENRYYYREIPLEDELEIIFKNFEPKNLYYWHDVGHAEVIERLGLGCHKRMLDKFSSRLIGVHLHDIIGALGDHMVPGFGTFDFRMLKPHLNDRTLKVIEVHQPATAEEIRQGTAYLERVLA